ncbi:T7SS effector LXG polymorphic toxin [Metabacillus mangrovi]|uniref:T7SS effector LXG polymorphic toxin n=1 Tax=Metabacillus mangrovi TaxID=1491830 RepID=UPI0030C7FA2A
MPGEIADHNLSEKTFIREEFVEGEVRDGIEKSREMVVDQKETPDKILSGIKDILPLKVGCSEIQLPHLLLDKNLHMRMTKLVLISKFP